MTTRGLGHRTSENAYYLAVSQSPLAQGAIALTETPLVPEDDDDVSVVEEIAMVVETTPAIRWVHFVFGCAVLLPWNGVLAGVGGGVPLRPTDSPDRDDHRDALFPVPTRRLFIATYPPILRVPHIHRI